MTKARFKNARNAKKRDGRAEVFGKMFWVGLQNYLFGVVQPIRINLISYNFREGDLARSRSPLYLALMVTQTQIRKYASRIGDSFHPERVILFGSYARGTPTEDSDVDFLVIMDHDKPRNVEQAIAIRLATDAPFPMDLLVKRPSEVAERLNMGDTFFTGLIEDGAVLYD